MVISNEQIVSIHTAQGVQLYQFTPDDSLTLTWSRELRDVSRCELTTPSPIEYGLLPDLMPWLHWVSVWDGSGRELYWTGPLQKVTTDCRTLAISARDVGSLMTRTRSPLTKKWEYADPAVVANELWELMLNHHGVRAEPLVRKDPLGDPFSFETKADEKMLDAVMSELVNVGLRWTVVSGVPVLGPAPLKPIAALGEHDFTGSGLSLIRDGSEVYNDVLLRSADNVTQASVPMSGLKLQSLVTEDSMFGVDNTDRAVRQYLRHTAAMRDAVMVGSDAALHPDAPIGQEQLIPSARFTLEAYGLLTLMELEAVEVNLAQGRSDVTVRMESVNDDLPELLKAQKK
jgi:hypothetical protein